jgi:hypothetical protein
MYHRDGPLSTDLMKLQTDSVLSDRRKRSTLSLVQKKSRNQYDEFILSMQTRTTRCVPHVTGIMNIVTSFRLMLHNNGLSE